jgi:hypothetical protein
VRLSAASTRSWKNRKIAVTYKLSIILTIILIMNSSIVVKLTNVKKFPPKNLAESTTVVVKISNVNVKTLIACIRRDSRENQKHEERDKILKA